MSFYNEQGSKTGILEVQGMADVEPGQYSSAPMEKGWIAPEQTVQSEDPRDTHGETVSPSQRTTRRSDGVSPGTKELAGTTSHHNLSA